jgi:hypothetical protein
MLRSRDSLADEDAETEALIFIIELIAEAVFIEGAVFRYERGVA